MLSLPRAFSSKVQSIEKALSLAETFLWEDFTGREGFQPRLQVFMRQLLSWET